MVLHRYVGAILLLASVSNASPTLPSIFARDPPKMLPAKATANDLKWQPAMDFDKDSCYNTPAIDAQGNIAPGLSTNNAAGGAGCRDASDLVNNNVYSRQRCNNGWCAYLYDYYMEKDTKYQNAPLGGGHRHEWEHVVIWVKNDQLEYVAASRHGGYTVKDKNDPAVQIDSGTHAKIVYHKDGGSTHAFRFPKTDGTDEPPENHSGKWYISPGLVSYNGFPSTGLRDKLVSYDFGTATIAFKDAKFADNLKKAAPKGITFDFGRDENSPGTP
ncbi:NPP1-domain-containing protein [Annulohypoxylon maeteangense]|uniref:NPP1-domain-containing protein n=1 Tax=Annulohypoxylon maeteangense TaxID=1927788 RepID=UPI002007745D|nr:NPP1-domain-containing protein [Annulohypoxylon maeteangense]KAI0882075.1 NPP1-domain-containing protein [Annulohypoxylon maeteangense]